MFDICNKCGKLINKIEINDIKDFSKLKCNHCGNSVQFKKLPIFFLSGASGVGKTTIGTELVQLHDIPVIPIESDILWNETFNTPEDNYKKYRELWLKLCKNINQGGKPVLLVGCVIPEQIESCNERHFFSESHYIVLTRSENEIRNSLTSRPDFRNSASEQNILEHISFNNWLINNSEKTSPKMHRIDASSKSIEETTMLVKEKINEIM